MRHFISYLLIALFMFSVSHDAFAKRFGGGRSFGGHRSQHSVSPSPTASQKAKPTTQQSANPRRGGIIGGLLVGGLLASLFMAHGFGPALLSWLVLGFLAFFLIQFFRKKMQPHLQARHVEPVHQNKSNNSSPFNPHISSASNHCSNSSNFSTKFDAESFLRAMKVSFIRLQAAYDQKNMQDLVEFTAPDVFAEIKMQLEERGAELNVTEVIHLNAELLNVSEQTNETIASVRFTGQIKENNKSNELDEVWHFRRSANNDNWIVTGIEQSAVSELV